MTDHCSNPCLHGSRCTSAADLLKRSPRSAACLNRPSAVHSAKRICATSSGRVHSLTSFDASLNQIPRAMAETVPLMHSSVRELQAAAGQRAWPTGHANKRASSIDSCVQSSRDSAAARANNHWRKRSCSSSSNAAKRLIVSSGDTRSRFSQLNRCWVASKVRSPTKGFGSIANQGRR